ncbi:MULTISPECIES: HAD family phosphatase [Vagococcus]|uniref:HAD-superfamily hydrolase, subfamily IA, variant 3 n=1 Tax=Vagococcus fluvialis bH819 TaxID=1255619 RepID=A0A1X6WLZ9_9ENTE|nr:MULTISPECIES: HAD family phosphatase [Vagococcus]SLM85289.1 HAD-superfamily hydrolase, subfamily IA, variant 3 [Vagococcus fluvialis bH819]HCM89415.1 HAD family phosphatase [Vagococcus sp.]
MKKISGVIFDMDGLILDTEAIYSASNIEMAKKYGLKGYDEAYYKTEIGLSEEHVFKKYIEDYPYLAEPMIREFFDESRQVVRETFKETGAPLKKGIVELLTYLKKVNIPCIVASSNTEETIEDLLIKANLKDYFIGSVSSNDVTHAKPDPEIVEKALEKLGTKRNETVMLEDSLNGIRASYSAGVPVIMVPDLLEPTDEAIEKSYMIKKDLLEVLTFIKEI